MEVGVSGLDADSDYSALSRAAAPDMASLVNGIGVETDVDFGVT